MKKNGFFIFFEQCEKEWLDTDVFTTKKKKYRYQERVEKVKRNFSEINDVIN